MPYISTNDLDLFIHTIIQERIVYNSTLANYPNNQYTGGFDNYIVGQFTGGKVIDNWGVDLFIGDNLQELQNETQTQYLVTYRRDNQDLYDVENCNQIIKYDFSVMIKDCPNSKARLNLIMDELIYYLTDPDKKLATISKILSTRVDFGINATTNPRQYKTNLASNKILLRKDCFYEEIASKSTKINFLSGLFVIEMSITINNNPKI